MTPAESYGLPATRRVVCAAIRSDDGDILLGIRHYSTDMCAQMHARNDGAKFAHRRGDDQGFVDQHGTYMTREEAFKVASAAGQIIRTFDNGCGRLYSENLY